jgi:hypothetical protein
MSRGLRSGNPTLSSMQFDESAESAGGSVEALQRQTKAQGQRSHTTTGMLVERFLALPARRHLLHMPFPSDRVTASLKHHEAPLRNTPFALRLPQNTCHAHDRSWTLRAGTHHSNPRPASQGGPALLMIHQYSSQSIGREEARTCSRVESSRSIRLAALAAALPGRIFCFALWVCVCAQKNTWRRLGRATRPCGRGNTNILAGRRGQHLRRSKLCRCRRC